VNNITLKSELTFFLEDEVATLSCGAHFATALQSGLTIYLHGDLGAGKTTFVRGVLHGLGYVGKVRSPTYTLVETYTLERANKLNVKCKYTIYHFDLYRFSSDEEWDAAGFRDYFNAQSICMVEWPEKALAVLPAPDIDVQLSMVKRDETDARQIKFSANSTLGEQCLAQNI
jgi:tRNA threonylcarbamoyladenosine biosynthesis protein TsaE